MSAVLHICVARQHAACNMHHHHFKAAADNGVCCGMCAVLQASSCCRAAVCWAPQVHAVLDEEAGKGLEVKAGHCWMLKACAERRAHACAQFVTPYSSAPHIPDAPLVSTASYIFATYKLNVVAMRSREAQSSTQVAHSIPPHSRCMHAP
jgi:hypothetical protein